MALNVNVIRTKRHEAERNVTIFSAPNLTFICHRVPAHVPPAVAGQLAGVADQVDVQARAR